MRYTKHILRNAAYDALNDIVKKDGHDTIRDDRPIETYVWYYLKCNMTGIEGMPDIRDEHIAAIMGNINAESKFDPMNAQDESFWGNHNPEYLSDGGMDMFLEYVDISLERERGIRWNV
jgi:hypothetical protein